jgi:hypothetical protein
VGIHAGQSAPSLVMRVAHAGGIPRVVGGRECLPAESVARRRSDAQREELMTFDGRWLETTQATATPSVWVPKGAWSALGRNTSDLALSTAPEAVEFARRARPLDSPSFFPRQQRPYQGPPSRMLEVGGVNT